MGDVDGWALSSFYGGGDGRWSTLMIALTILGSGWTALLLVPLLWHARTRAAAVALTVAIVGQATLVWWLKAAFGRVRPWIAFGWPAPIGTPHDPSFPSGHAAGSFCVAAFLAVVLPVVWPGSRRVALVLAGAAVGLASLVAASRVYLGAHFPSDVAMGALLGSGAGAAAAVAYLRQRRVLPSEAGALANQLEGATKKG